MDASHPLPFVVHVDDMDDPGDVLDALILGPFIAGEQPHARIVRLHRVRPDATLLPPAVRPVRVAVDGGFRCQIAAGDGWTLRTARWKDGTARLTVTAVSEELARDVLRRATAGAVEPTRPLDEAVTIGFWHATCRRPVRKEREVDAAPWPRIRRNYSAAAAATLERVMAVTPADVGGRLLLFHGPPGTGKTTALRALAHAWRRWCRLDYVLDPERLFADSGYLMAAALGDDGEDEDDGENEHEHDGSGNGGGGYGGGGNAARGERWRLLVLEDCDELIRADAKQGSGQALSRLLNLTDGLLGQGLNVLVALTTNEPLFSLHPAVVRPGRCLAHVEVGKLSRGEAVAWLGTATGVGQDGATLADLYALRGELHRIGPGDRPAAVGLYI
jgi:hypothetical protein